MMRFLVAAFALLLSAGAAAAQEQRDISGAWGAQATDRRDHPDYFSATLTQDDHGRLSGAGLINLCAACAGFDEYAVQWSGHMKGEELFLVGTAQEPSVRNPPVYFAGRLSADGAQISGALRVPLEAYSVNFRMVGVAPAQPRPR